MAYPIEIKLKAVKLRQKGLSLNDIQQKLNISKSVLSAWLRDVVLSNDAKKIILKKIKLGQLNSAENKHKKTKQSIENYFTQAIKNVDIPINKNLAKILCSVIYWCEGTKSLYSGINFTNSDPKLVKTFLKLFRKSFDANEKKFRVCIHLHNYHNENKQSKFWSKITGIKLSQFIKPFYKNNVGKRVREDYNGCVSIRYHDTTIARQLLMTAKAFLLKHN